MTTKTSTLHGSLPKTPNAVGRSSRLGSLSQWLNHSWKLTTLPLLLFIALPLLSLFLRTSVADLLANLNQGQVVRAVGLSLSTSLATTAITLLTGTRCLPLAPPVFVFYQVIDTLSPATVLPPPLRRGPADAFGRKGSSALLAALVSPFPSRSWPDHGPNLHRRAPVREGGTSVRRH